MKLTMYPDGVTLSWRGAKGDIESVTLGKDIMRVDVDNITLSGDGFTVKLYAKVDELDMHYSLLGTKVRQKTKLESHTYYEDSGDELGEKSV